MRSVVTIPTGAVADSASTRKGSALSEPDREEQPADGKENRTVLYPRTGGMKRIVITTGEDHRLVTGKPVRERTHRNRSGEMPHPMVRPCGRKSPDIIGFADISLPRRGKPPGTIHRRMLAGARGKGRTGHETSGQRSHATTGARARQIVAAPERPVRQPKPAPFPTVEDGRDPAASAARFRKDRCQCPSGGKARGEEFLKQSALPRRRQHGGRTVDTDQRPARKSLQEWPSNRTTAVAGRRVRRQVTDRCRTVKRRPQGRSRKREQSVGFRSISSSASAGPRLQHASGGRNRAKAKGGPFGAALA